MDILVAFRGASHSYTTQKLAPLFAPRMKDRASMVKRASPDFANGFRTLISPSSFSLFYLFLFSLPPFFSFLFHSPLKSHVLSMSLSKCVYLAFPWKAIYIIETPPENPLELDLRLLGGEKNPFIVYFITERIRLY